MSPSERREERELQKFFKANGGQPIGCLAERSQETRMFDAVTATYRSVMTGKALASGTRVKLWSGAIEVAP